jgi:hypothetical protein
MSRQAKRRLGYVHQGRRLAPGARTRVVPATGVMSAEVVPPVVCGQCWQEMVPRTRTRRLFHLCQRCRRQIGGNELAVGVLVGMYERRRGRGQADVDLEQLANALHIKPVQVGDELAWVGVNQDTLSLHWTEHGGMSKIAVVGSRL